MGRKSPPDRGKAKNCNMTATRARRGHGGNGWGRKAPTWGKRPKRKGRRGRPAGSPLQIQPDNETRRFAGKSGSGTEGRDWGGPMKVETSGGPKTLGLKTESHGKKSGHGKALNSDPVRTRPSRRKVSKHERAFILMSGPSTFLQE